MNEKTLQLETSDKYSLRGQVFDRLREDILSERYHRNDELKELTIANELGVSRTPVREALRQLELEGLVNIIPNKGAYVVGITYKDISDIYEMRSMLEGLCARWATAYITDKEIEMLEEIEDLAEFHAFKERHEKVLDLDNKFHNILYAATGSRMLNLTMTNFHHYLESTRKITLSANERVRQSIEEHRAIISAIKAGDTEAAERAAINHMKNTIINIENKHILV